MEKFAPHGGGSDKAWNTKHSLMFELQQKYS